MGGGDRQTSILAPVQLIEAETGIVTREAGYAVG